MHCLSKDQAGDAMKRAMILAAGRGERMGILTETTPKPLLRIGRHYLIEHVIYRIKEAGIQEIIINISYLGEQIKEVLGDGSRYGVSLHYSFEAERLETGGGIAKALPFFGDDPFLVVSGDVITDYPLAQLAHQPQGWAHLVMVDNPDYHAEGDFVLHENKLSLTGTNKLTFANIGVYRKELFTKQAYPYFKLTQVLNPAITAGLVTGERYQGRWFNVGTPADLKQAEEMLVI